MSPSVPHSFADKVVDVIGCSPDEPDSVLRETFATCGDIAWVARWSSSGQKHHAFVGFKLPNAASKALAMSMPRNKDWRLSRLNPDLKSRVVDLLPKYIQVKIKAEETAYTRWIEHNPPPPSAGGPGGPNSGPPGPSAGQAPDDHWHQSSGDPPRPERHSTDTYKSPQSYGAEGEGSWSTSHPSGSNTWGPPPYAPTSNGYADFLEHNPSLSYNPYYNPPMGPNGEVLGPNNYLPPRPPHDSMPLNYSSVNPHDGWATLDWSENHLHSGTTHPNSPLPQSATSASFLGVSGLPPKPVAALERMSDWDSTPRRRLTPPPLPPRLTPPPLPPSGPARTYSPPRPPKGSAPMVGPLASRSRKDSRVDDRESDDWNTNRRERGERDRDQQKRPRSSSRPGEKDKGNARERDRDRGRGRERGRGPSRSPSPRPDHHTSSKAQNTSARSNRAARRNTGDSVTFRPRDTARMTTRGLSPGQVSTASRSSDDDHNAPPSRRSRSLTPPSRSRNAPSMLEDIVMSFGDRDLSALIEALTKNKAPVASWMEVVSRYRRQNELDNADQLALAGVAALEQEPSPAPVKPLYLVLANTHSTRARQAPPNSDDANNWQAKASEWIRKAQALGSASGDAENATDGLAWLERHMLDKSLPPRDKITTSFVSPAVNSLQPLPTGPKDRAHDREKALLSPARGGSASRSGPSKPNRSTNADPVKYAELQVLYQAASTQLKSEQAENRRLKDKLRTQEDQLRALQAAVSVAGTTSGSGGGSRPRDSEEAAQQLLRQAEVERLRLLAVVNEERLAKRRAEDAEQEERSVRRKLEDQLWSAGAGSLPLPPPGFL